MTLQLLAIQFNHDFVDKRRSALNIRIDADTPIILPEWHVGMQGEVISTPAAYAIDQVDETQLAINAAFAWSGPSVRQVQIRAIQPNSGQLPWWLWISPQTTQPSAAVAGLLNWDDYARYLGYRQLYGAWRKSIAAESNVLGEIKPTWHAIYEDGVTGMQSLQLQNVRLRSRGVGVHEVVWRWQYRLKATQEWTDFASSKHLIYCTLRLPTLPWVQVPFVTTNIALPWAEVLEFSCRWASGTFNRDAAARRITEEVFRLGNSVLEYGCPLWACEMYANTALNLFDCSALLERLHGGVGNGPYVNCTDCACIVSTFANVLGADLWQSRMGAYVPAFMTRDVLTIGSRQWQAPCGWGLGFMFHEAAWKGNCVEADGVFDACLAVDANLDGGSSLHFPILPCNLPFGWPGDGHYRSLLAQPTDQLVCQPRPVERRRRAVV